MLAEEIPVCQGLYVLRKNNLYGFAVFHYLYQPSETLAFVRVHKRTHNDEHTAEVFFESFIAKSICTFEQN